MFPNITFFYLSVKLDFLLRLCFSFIKPSKWIFKNIETPFLTSVYRKPTYTALLTNFFSFKPCKYKIDLAKTLLDRMLQNQQDMERFW